MTFGAKFALIQQVVFAERVSLRFLWWMNMLLVEPTIGL